MAKKDGLYTLTEVSKKTGISMPTLQRYKKEHQDRIPSEGSGRTQRYPKEALAVFEEIKQENLKKRGRPKKSSKKASRKKSGKKRAAASRRGSGRAKSRRSKKRSAGRATRGGGELLSLSEIGRRTGISYPTLLNYTKKHLSRIPHVGSGRKRRYPEEAAAAFEEIYAESPRGRGRKKAAAKARRGRSGASVTDRALAGKIRQLEKAQQEVSRRLDEVIEILKQPVRVTINSA